MIVRDLLEEHVDQAGHLWSIHNVAAFAPHYDLGDLERLDDRIDAHLDGLRLSIDAAWDVCLAALELEEEPGPAFTAMVIAVERRDLAGIATVLDAVGRVPELEDAVGAGLGWVSLEDVSAVLPGLLDPSCPPPLQRLGIDASARHRIDPGSPLDYAIFGDDAKLRARGLRAYGEIGRHQRIKDIRPLLASPDPESRFWAAWSLGVAGDPDALPVLWEHVEGGGPHVDEACAVAFRRTDDATAGQKVRALGGNRDTFRTAVVCAGIVGEPGIVSWLLQCMEYPKLARVAGESFARITGVDLERERLHQKPPEGAESGPNDDPKDPNVALDADDRLPWPNPAAVSRWWEQNRRRFPPGQRYLLGQPKTPPWLQKVLREGNQRVRGAAALELSLAEPGTPIFDVAAPALRQRAALRKG